MTSELSGQAVEWQLVLNFLSMTLIQWAKNSDWKLFAWINQERPKVTKFISVLIAAATASGIHGSFLHQEGGVFTITISGLTLIAATHMLKDVVQNYLGIKIMYRLMRPDEYSVGNGKAKLPLESAVVSPHTLDLQPPKVG